MQRENPPSSNPIAQNISPETLQQRANNASHEYLHTMMAETSKGEITDSWNCVPIAILEKPRTFQSERMKRSDRDKLAQAAE